MILRKKKQKVRPFLPRDSGARILYIIYYLFIYFLIYNIFYMHVIHTYIIIYLFFKKNILYTGASGYRQGAKKKVRRKVNWHLTFLYLYCYFISMDPELLKGVSLPFFSNVPISCLNVKEIIRKKNRG
jgi:hypothetical protein